MCLVCSSVIRVSHIQRRSHLGDFEGDNMVYHAHSAADVRAGVDHHQTDGPRQMPQLWPSVPSRARYAFYQTAQ
jgi:hypothetical protein